MIDISFAATLGQTLPLYPAPGEYFSIVKILTIVVLVGPWLYFCPWVSKDALVVRAHQGLWACVIVGSGTLGVLFWLLIPYFFVGMMLFIVLVTASFAVYITYRNGRVTPENKVFTRDFFANLFQKKEVVEEAPKSKVKLYNFQNKIALAPGSEAAHEDIVAYNLTQDLLYDMLWRRASQADLSPAGQETRVRFVIDGMLTERPSMPLAESEAIIQFLKPVAGMSGEDRRRPQKGKISVDVAKGATAIAIMSAGTTGGQRMQFRVEQEIVQTRLPGLGMSDEVLANVQKLCKQPGLLIVSGRPHSGVTSTLYSLLREQDAFTQQIVTFEKTPAVELENITQQAYGEDAELADKIAAALRREPDVLMVDNCTTAEAAAEVIQAAREKVVFLGMQASDTFNALAKWAKLSGKPHEALQGLRGILSQILVRKLCTQCREPYKPDPQMLAKANWPAKGIETFYRTPTAPPVDEKGNPIICSVCQGSGYFGRTAAFELLEMSDDLREQVYAGASLAEIKSACRKKKMLYLQEQALRKVLDGTTSIQEVIRVSQSSQPKKQGA